MSLIIIILWLISPMLMDGCLQVVEGGTVKLKHLQVLGKPAISGGLAIFPHPATAASLSPQNQARFLFAFLFLGYEGDVHSLQASKLARTPDSPAVR